MRWKLLIGLDKQIINDDNAVLAAISSILNTTGPKLVSISVAASRQFI